MARGLILLVLLLIVGVVAIVVIRLRVMGRLHSPLDDMAMEPGSTPGTWPSIEGNESSSPPTPSPPNGAQVPAGPPEGWVLWGDKDFRKNAKIQSNHDGVKISGYVVPVRYMSDGTLAVASKYPDHSACIWSYDTVTGKFTVLHRKTRQAVVDFENCENISDLAWCEETREYSSGQFPPSLVKSASKTELDILKRLAQMPIPEGRWAKRCRVTLRGRAEEDACYEPKSPRAETEGHWLRSEKYSNWTFPLNKGALELNFVTSSLEVTLPLSTLPHSLWSRSTMNIVETSTQRVLDSIPANLDLQLSGLRDLSRGLAMGWYSGLSFSPLNGRIVLLSYPKLRVVAQAQFPGLTIESMHSLTDGLALDILVKAPCSSEDPGPPRLAQDNSLLGNILYLEAQLYRVRVPNNWRDVPGRKDLDCLDETDPVGLAKLEVTTQGMFDMAKYDAYETSGYEKGPEYDNLESPYVFRDGVMYWRKRHTGEVVMASVDNLDTQTIIGGEGATWDGFRVNPARDEVVTWRENGELVFWKIQFPAAEPLCKVRVITEETPHRLEAM